MNDLSIKEDEIHRVKHLFIASLLKSRDPDHYIEDSYIIHHLDKLSIHFVILILLF
uniref:Uncharacterized protein n=1 Tax=Lepeophtheirus salmonis TaxID=72036 RepID=A0A0K2T0K2_LEPSM